MGAARNGGSVRHQNGKYFLFKFPSTAKTLFSSRSTISASERKREKRARKSSTRAEIITFKLAIFLFMIKYEFEMPWHEWWRTPLSVLCQGLTLKLPQNIMFSIASLIEFNPRNFLQHISIGSQWRAISDFPPAEYLQLWMDVIWLLRIFIPVGEFAA